VAAGEDGNKKKESKGFAGLSSLVSNVDTTPPPAPKKKPVGSAEPTARPTPQSAQPQPSQRQTYQEPAQPPSSGSSGGKWALGIAIVIGVLWLNGQSNKTTTTSPASAYSPSAQSTTPSYSPQARPQAPSRPTESKPPVGQDLVFTREQIWYCLAEDIRMEGAKSALNNYSNYDVDRFNAMVADYNSRCSNFRYRRGSLESVRSSIEPYRSQLYFEGQQRMMRYSPQSSVFPPKTAPVSYDEKSAINLACITTKSEGAASYNRCLVAQLRELQNAPRTPSLNGLSYQEKSSIQLACLTEKSSGAAACNRCLIMQLSSIGR
jgi:hypothetical protein